MNHSFKPQVKVFNESGWSENNTAFATEEEAMLAANDIQARWMAVEYVRTCTSDQKPNYTFNDGVLTPIEDSHHGT